MPLEESRAPFEETCSHTCPRHQYLNNLNRAHSVTVDGVIMAKHQHPPVSPGKKLPADLIPVLFEAHRRPGAGDRWAYVEPEIDADADLEAIEQLEAALKGAEARVNLTGQLREKEELEVATAALSDLLHETTQESDRLKGDHDTQIQLPKAKPKAWAKSNPNHNLLAQSLTQMDDLIKAIHQVKIDDRSWRGCGCPGSEAEEEQDEPELENSTGEPDYSNCRWCRAERILLSKGAIRVRCCDANCCCGYRAARGRSGTDDHSIPETAIQPGL